MERLGGEIAGFLVKIGGVIALVLGVIEILKGFALLLLANLIGGCLLPGAGWLLKLRAQSYARYLISASQHVHPFSQGSEGEEHFRCLRSPSLASA